MLVVCRLQHVALGNAKIVLQIGRSEQSKAKQSKAKQSKAKQSKAKQSKSLHVQR
jgi:hypothetical protein